jgi:hypothetical protein
VSNDISNADDCSEYDWVVLCECPLFIRFVYLDSDTNAFVSFQPELLTVHSQSVEREGTGRKGLPNRIKA